MRFLQVDTISGARERLLQEVGDNFLKMETVKLSEAYGKCLAEDIYAEENIPDFRRATVDGYAVKASDTQGAGESVPVFLSVVDEISIGKPALREIKNGECAYVPTGGMIPDGADAMVMVEYTELFDKRDAAVYSSVSAGNGVVQIGEDAKKGELLLSRGTVLHSAQTGVLASLGKHTVKVYAPWHITIISTGDELAEVGEEKGRCQVYDINTHALYALAKEQGMTVDKAFSVKDEDEKIEQALKDALLCSDIVVISGGSSQGKKDMTADIIDKIAEPGVWTHGLALKPGKPTIVGMDKPSGTLIIGLPGHPVAAIMVFQLLLVWLQKNLRGEKEAPGVPAVLSSNIPGAAGRAVCQTVKLEKEENGYRAIPVFGKSGLMHTLTQADGYVLVEADKEGICKGETVYVQLL
ncbi:MAG: gephyrin-like molybdotransferase Glp [Blautia sp.]|nr:molybdopterin molybdotransferase MoeA [Clostridiales bacterium]